MSFQYSIDDLNRIADNTLARSLGIELTEIGEGYLIGKMPVDNRTKQPFGILHGGASVALAETLGSIASMQYLDESKQFCVGLEINANHVKSVTDGYVYGKALAVHIGKKTHIWDIRITNETGELVCISRLTMVVLDKDR